MKALITGITGQDGSYLAELLLKKGYKVHGIIRRSSTSATSRIDHLIKNPDIFNKSLFIHCGDLLDTSRINTLIGEIKPDEIYNLAAQSDVRVSFDQSILTTQVNAMGVLAVLDAVKNQCCHAKVYQASTSEMFGGVNIPATGYTEESYFCPKNPYAIAKLHAYWTVRNYRDSYDIFACNGILFNHESPRRGLEFVTKKITNWCGMFMSGNHQEVLELGNLNSYRDWGHAKDYAEAMCLILQAPEPSDWLVATGETHTVREFVEKCFRWMEMPLVWEGCGIDEVGKVENEVVIRINPKYFRPSEVNVLMGDSTKIRTKLGWKHKVTFDDLVDEMMTFELKMPKD